MISPKELALQYKTGLCEYYLEIYNHTYYYSLKFSKVVHHIQGIIHGGGGGKPWNFSSPAKVFPLQKKLYPPLNIVLPPQVVFTFFLLTCIYIYLYHGYQLKKIVCTLSAPHSLPQPMDIHVHIFSITPSTHLFLVYPEY